MPTAPPLLETLESVIGTLGVGPGELSGGLARVTAIPPTAYAAINEAGAIACFDTVLLGMLPRTLGAVYLFAG
ncbi:MAG: hypothetical protein JSR77_10395 [Planctomycetes bacterium]|nr:hypothetical protein [Planctomycetota bacterium]